MFLPQMPQQPRELFQLLPFPRIHQQRGPREIALARRVQLRKNGNQTNRQIVHTVVAHVLKRVEDRAFPGAGKPGKDDKLAAGGLACGGFACGSLLHDGKGLEVVSEIDGVDTKAVPQGLKPISS